MDLTVKKLLAIIYGITPQDAAIFRFTAVEN
jgi:hypothetical protein